MEIFVEKFLKSRMLAGFIVFVFVLKVAILATSINFPNNIFFASIVRSQLVQMLNQTRASMGLSPLQESEKLNETALLKAQDMVENGYFNHTSPTGVTPWHWFYEAGYDYKYAGENLAVGFYDSSQVYRAWLDSPSHKENIISPYYTEVGTAVLDGFGPNNAAIVVQVFGAQKTVVTTQPTKTPQTESQKPNQQPESNQQILQIQETQVGPEPESASQPSPELEESQVLSSSVVIDAGENAGLSNFYLKAVNFMLYNYQSALQYVIYTILIAVFASFSYLLSLNLDTTIKNGIATRALALIAIAAISAIISPELVASILPHQIRI